MSTIYLMLLASSIWVSTLGNIGVKNIESIPKTIVEIFVSFSELFFSVTFTRLLSLFFSLMVLLPNLNIESVF